MSVAEIITFIRNITYCTTGELTDAELLPFINIAYHDIENKITRYVDEDYFWDRFYTDLVANQNEYTLKSGSSTARGMNKVKRVEIKYADTDTYRTVAPLDTVANYKESTDFLESQVSKSSPFFDIVDNSIMIYPTPTANMTAGLYIEATSSLIDLTTSDAETLVFPGNTQLRAYHYIIGLGAAQYVFNNRSQEDKANNAMNKYEKELRMMLRDLSNRYSSTMEAELPNLQFYRR